MNNLNFPPTIQILFTLITSFIITFYSVPSVIKVAILKDLLDAPCKRKKHTRKVPMFGGISIFAGFIISTTFWSNQQQIGELQYIISSLIILFFIGMKDDIINLVAKKKFIGQFLAAITIVAFGDIRLTSLYGTFGIYEIPYIFSLIFSTVTVIGITNSFNLIDGIDTLASSIGLITCTLMGGWFFLVGHQQYAIVASAMVGSLFAFMYYNKTPAKIFMGDTGSLVLGLICSIITIKFIEFNRDYSGPPSLHIKSVPAVAISIIIVPIFDTLRVIILRLLLGKSPFSADRNHIHHILTDLRYTHLKTTFILSTLTISLSSLTFLMRNFQGEGLLIMNLIFMFTFTSYFTRKRRNYQKSFNNVEPLKKVIN